MSNVLEIGFEELFVCEINCFHVIMTEGAISLIIALEKVYRTMIVDIERTSRFIGFFLYSRINIFVNAR